MKGLRQQFHQMHEVIQKLTESLADYREENRDLSLAVKNLEMQNIQQKKLIEDMARKMTRESKNVENKIHVKATQVVEDYLGKRLPASPRVRALQVNSKNTEQVAPIYKLGADSLTVERREELRKKYGGVQPTSGPAWQANSKDTAQVTSDYKLNGATSLTAEQREELQKKLHSVQSPKAPAWQAITNSKDTAQVISNMLSRCGS